MSAKQAHSIARRNPMEWEIALQNNGEYLEVVTRGDSDKDGSLEMAVEIQNRMRDSRIEKALIDHRNLSSVRSEIGDIYRRPKELLQLGAPTSIRIAEIIKPEHADHFRFFETVCLNQGFRFSLFYERRAAIDWLLK
jgi:hypothetical protein